jgi:hypothetical protein
MTKKEEAQEAESLVTTKYDESPIILISEKLLHRELVRNVLDQILLSHPARSGKETPALPEKSQEIGLAQAFQHHGELPAPRAGQESRLLERGHDFLYVTKLRVSQLAERKAVTLSVGHTDKEGPFRSIKFSKIPEIIALGLTKKPRIALLHPRQSFLKMIEVVKRLQDR